MLQSNDIPLAQQFQPGTVSETEDHVLPDVNACSPTLTWTQCPALEPPYLIDFGKVCHAKGHLSPIDVITAMRDSSVKALGGLAGITLIFSNEKLRIQVQAPADFTEGRPLNSLQELVDGGRRFAGKGQGLDHPFGRLLIHSIGLMVIFGIPVGAMENVPGLVDHPHWKEVSALLKTLSIPSTVVVNDLAHFGFMSRSRCFLLFGAGHQVKSHKQESRPNWWDVFGPLTDETAIVHTAVPLSVRKALSCKSLLPENLRHAALMGGFVEDESILSLRVHESGMLPTLVASYRRQTLLSPDHLCKKGILTWLLPARNMPGKVRFLDMFEGARALGFEHTLCLPADLDTAMMCVGNAVSPAQALLANMHWTLVDARICRSVASVHPEFWPLLVQAKLFPVPSDSAFSPAPKLRFAFLPSARPDGILECVRVLNDQSLALFVRLRDFPVLLIDGDVVVQIGWPSLHPLAGLQHLCTPSLSIPFGLPVWTWNTCSPIELAVSEEFQGILTREILFIAAGEVRCWKFRPGFTVLQAAYVFHPFGEMLLSPLTRIGEDQPLAQIDFSQLLQGWSGIHVVRYEDFADLETVTAANLCACASAVLVVGAAGEGIAKRFPAKASKVLVPGWVQHQAVALRCTLIQTGDDKVETKSTGELNFQEAAPMYAVVQVYIHKVDAQEKWILLSNEGLRYSLQEARSVQATLPNSLGLTRSKLGIGVRVLATEYKAAKKKIFPQAIESSDSEEGGTRRFQLLGVPDQCTRFGSSLSSSRAYGRRYSSAALRAKPGGLFDIVWSGVVPGSCQSIFRAELLAVSCAFARSSKPVVFTDSKSVARIAQRILDALRSGFPPSIPTDHRDFWAFFLSAARDVDLEDAQVHWIKGHVDYKKVAGPARVHAWFNHWADAAAKQALQGHFNPLFKAVLCDFQRLSRLARDLHQFQAGESSMSLSADKGPGLPISGTKLCLQLT
eukprot:s518_g20.t1